eukprot:TRINITY_DN110344_c0_g1_i1.p1 TRINITY_DN110344_c0_g1~~TRINITY_DN110344_c0_g1_i1.p1  ORF type:complete len:366 (-),score=66.60 TRINITY_DN110344_c0_g1_i1:111-1208(-)
MGPVHFRSAALRSFNTAGIVPRLRSKTSSRSSSGHAAGGEGGADFDGPILADFLAMGAGKVGRAVGSQGVVSQQGSSQSKEQRQKPQGQSLKGSRSSAGEKAFPSSAPSVVLKERAVVVAALERGRALAQVQAESLPRVPLQPQRLQPEKLYRVPSLFAEGYAEYARTVRGEEETSGTEELDMEEVLTEEEGASQQSEATRSSLRTRTVSKPRLEVKAWHRVTLQKMLCRSLLFQFLQDLRKARGLGVEAQPLWLWEAKRAQEFSEAGQIMRLIKYLARTELHIKYGERRGRLNPGAVPMSEAATILIEERRQFVKSEIGQGVNKELSEDQLLREFLDGEMSWKRIFRNLSEAPLLPREAREGAK